jgi:hypothetical protein
MTFFFLDIGQILKPYHAYFWVGVAIQSQCVNQHDATWRKKVIVDHLYTSNWVSEPAESHPRYNYVKLSAT